MKRHLSITIATILALSAPGIAKGALFINASIGGVPTMSGATLENFDEANPSILTLSGPAYLLTGSDGKATPPYFSGSTAAYFGESPASGDDGSRYVTAEPGGSATLTFSTPQTYLGLLWGSVDPFAGMNVLTFYDKANNVIGTVQGGDVSSLFGGSIPNGSAYVNITSTTAFSSVVATATAIYPECFEFDDVAFAVPEPAGSVVFSAGLCVLVFSLRRKLAESVNHVG